MFDVWHRGTRPTSRGDRWPRASVPRRARRRLARPDPQLVRPSAAPATASPNWPESWVRLTRAATAAGKSARSFRTTGVSETITRTPVEARPGRSGAVRARGVRARLADKAPEQRRLTPGLHRTDADRADEHDGARAPARARAQTRSAALHDARCAQRRVTGREPAIAGLTPPGECVPRPRPCIRGLAASATPSGTCAASAVAADKAHAPQRSSCGPSASRRRSAPESPQASPGAVLPHARQWKRP